ncbi:hypothetical protein K0U07_04535 [bacterium]|nr:hypothetical protein [bacterium]
MTISNEALLTACRQVPEKPPKRIVNLKDLQEQFCIHDRTTKKTETDHLFHLPAPGKDEQYLCKEDAMHLIKRALPTTHPKYDLSFYHQNDRVIDLIYDGLRLIPFNGVFYTKLMTAGTTIRIHIFAKYHVDGVNGTIYQLEEVEAPVALAANDQWYDERSELLHTIISICSPFLRSIAFTHGRYAKYNPMILYARVCLWTAEKTKAFQTVRRFVQISAVVIPVLTFLATLFTIHRLTTSPFPFPFHQR